MNFLQLCQRLRDECSVAGAGPVTVIDQQGEYAKLVNWIRDANLEIQAKYFNWSFLYSNCVFTTEPGTREYRPPMIPEDIHHFDRDTFRINDCQILSFNYDWFNAYTMNQVGEPDLAILMPDNAIMLDPVPDDEYPVSFRYWRKPQVLKEDTDIPWIPEPYQMAIVYLAMNKYANYDNAPEIKQQGMDGYMSLLPQLEFSQLPGQEELGMVNHYDIRVVPE